MIDPFTGYGLQGGRDAHPKAQNGLQAGLSIEQSIEAVQHQGAQCQADQHGGEYVEDGFAGHGVYSLNEIASLIEPNGFADNTASVFPFDFLTANGLGFPVESHGHSFLCAVSQDDGDLVHGVESLRLRVVDGINSNPLGLIVNNYLIRTNPNPLGTVIHSLSVLYKS
jgi:hypothetical protein